MIDKIIKQSKKYIILQILFSILSTITIAIIPLLHKILIDQVIPQHSYILFKRILFCYLIVLGLYLLFTFISENFVWRTAIDFESRMQKSVFSKLTELSYKDYSDRKTEEYYAILTKNITQIEQDYLTPKISLVKSVFSIIIYGLITYYYNKVVFFIIMTLSIVVTIVPRIYKEKLRYLASRYIKQNEKYANIVNELLKAFDMLDTKVKESFNNKFSEETTELNKKRLNYGSIKILSNIVSGGLVMLLEMIVLLSSVYFAIMNIITLGEVVMFFSYSKSFTDPLTEVLYCLNAINSTEDIRNELEEFLNNKIDVLEEVDLFIDNKLVLSDVKVEYPDDKYIYNYEFQQGGKYIIYGESGSGKSTLLKLIGGKVSGNVKIDPYINYSVDEISYLSQDQIIFSDSFYNNVTLYGAYDYNKNLVKYEDLENYFKNEDVSVMSGGEKQKVKNIRNIIQNKEILLLDEPTTGMDDDTALRTMECLSKLDSTVVVVSHNLSVIDKDHWDVEHIDEMREIV